LFITLNPCNELLAFLTEFSTWSDHSNFESNNTPNTEICDRNILTCWDWFLKPLKIISTVETRSVFVTVKIFKIEIFYWNFVASRFLSRLLRLSRQIKVFEICWDFLTFIKKPWPNQNFWRAFVLKNLDKLRNQDQDKS
jgi:hypothetical protein